MKHHVRKQCLVITTDGGLEIDFHIPEDHVEEIHSGTCFCAYPTDDDLRHWYVQIDGELVTVYSLMDDAVDLMLQCRREDEIEYAAQMEEEASLRSQHRYL